MENPGQTGITADVEISSFEFALSDTNGVISPQPSDHLSRIRVRSGLQTYTDRLVYPTDGSFITLVLSPALTVPVNTPVDLILLGDIASSAGSATFRAQLGDSATFDVTDASSEERVPAVYAATPIVGPAVRSKRRPTPAASGTPRFPQQTTVGQTRRRGAYRATPSSGRTRCRTHPGRLALRAGARRAAPAATPSTYLDELRILWNGVEIASVPILPRPAARIGWRSPAPCSSRAIRLRRRSPRRHRRSRARRVPELAVFASGIRAA